MSKRAERRHHVARLVRKYRDVAKKWAGSANQWIHKWTWQWDEKTKQLSKQHHIDRTGERKRLEFIDETSRKLVNHHGCDCWMCHGERYNRRKDVPPIDE